MTHTLNQRPTLATIKSFINKNRDHLFIRYESSFDGMTDCVQHTGRTDFVPAPVPAPDRNHRNCLGIQGAWFVFGSRDYFSPVELEGFIGYSVTNCCGSFTLAVKK